MRIAVSGAPGVGKSTLIDALGVHLLEQGHRVAVLAVDPTSNRTGGSILGDKTRMPRLAASASAFIRPSPTSGNLGGVSRHTRAAISVCEAAGCDVILVETVGVGQSETAVRDMVDYFLLLALAGAGDELQGIKRGIIEVADAIAVTKADGDNLDRAKNAAARIRSSLRLFPAEESGWQPRTHTCSALEDRGIGEIWDAVLKYRDLTSENGFLRRRRRSQRVHWFDEEVLALQLAASRAGAHELRQEFCTRVSQGELHPSVAADEYCAQA